MNQYPTGTLNLEKIEDAIYSWIEETTRGVLSDNGQIVWRNQSQPLPARPCVTLKFIDGPRPIARNGSLFSNEGDSSFSVGVQMEATLSIQIFGNMRIHKPVARQLAIEINSSLLRQSVLDGLKRCGVSVQGVGSPRNLTALEETEYEERAGFEISLGLAQTVQDMPGTIETVNVESPGGRNKEINF